MSLCMLLWVFTELSSDDDSGEESSEEPADDAPGESRCIVQTNTFEGNNFPPVHLVILQFHFYTVIACK